MGEYCSFLKLEDSLLVRIKAKNGFKKSAKKNILAKIQKKIDQYSIDVLEVYIAEVPSKRLFIILSEIFKSHGVRSLDFKWSLKGKQTRRIKNTSMDDFYQQFIHQSNFSELGLMVLNSVKQMNFKLLARMRHSAQLSHLRLHHCLDKCQLASILKTLNVLKYPVRLSVEKGLDMFLLYVYAADNIIHQNLKLRICFPFLPHMVEKCASFVESVDPILDERMEVLFLVSAERISSLKRVKFTTSKIAKVMIPIWKIVIVGSITLQESMVSLSEFSVSSTEA